jgi:four helix bundle protein
MQSFHELQVWQKAHALTLRVYEATRAFPAEERFGITSQLRRAASSCAANIAEGCVRGSDAEFARFLRMSLGSASELEYHVLLAQDLSMLEAHTYGELNERVTEVKRMLTALIRKLRADG